MSDAERTYILSVLVVVPVRMFAGDLADLFKLQETHCLRIGCDDDWLMNLYERHMRTYGHMRMLPGSFIK